MFDRGKIRCHSDDYLFYPKKRCIDTRLSTTQPLSGHHPTSFNPNEVQSLPLSDSDIFQDCLLESVSSSKIFIKLISNLDPKTFNNEIHSSIIPDLVYFIAAEVKSLPKKEHITLQILKLDVNYPFDMICMNLATQNSSFLLSIKRVDSLQELQNLFLETINDLKSNQIHISSVLSTYDLRDTCSQLQIIFLRHFNLFNLGTDTELAIYRNMYEDCENLLDLWKLVIRIISCEYLSSNFKVYFLSFLKQQLDPIGIIPLFVVLYAHYPLQEDVSLLLGTGFDLNVLSMSSIFSVLSSIAVILKIDIDYADFLDFQSKRESFQNRFWSTELSEQEISESFKSLAKPSEFQQIFTYLMKIQLKSPDFTEIQDWLERGMDSEQVRNIFIVKNYINQKKRK